MNPEYEKSGNSCGELYTSPSLTFDNLFQIEKAKGIKQFYASPDRHPNVRSVVVTSVDEGEAASSTKIMDL